MLLRKPMIVVLCALGASSLLAGIDSGVARVEVSPVQMWFSSGPGDAPGEVVFSPALQAALKNNGERPYANVMALVAAVEAAVLVKHEGRQSSYFTGNPDVAPLCPSDGPLRVHLLVQVEYPHAPRVPGFQLDRERLPGAFRAACPNTVVTVHENIGKADWDGLLEAVGQSALEPLGRTLVYVSGQGAKIDGVDRVLAVDSPMKSKEQALEDSLNVAVLHGRLQSSCRNRCAVWLDVDRQAYPRTSNR